MEQKQIDRRVVERVKKLLALANDAGATEAEAALAAERARIMMAEYGISNATVEAAGGAGEARVADSRRGHVGKTWMRSIMKALCEQSFVMSDWRSPLLGERAGSWQLWGRESAVITVKLMHEYLVRTVDRVARERDRPTDEVFKSAMGERIAERVLARHQSAMAQQASEARATAHQSSTATANALVVVLEDYAQKEHDLNKDMRLGRTPGTTARLRHEEELERQRRDAEHEERLQARDDKRRALTDEGIDPDVVEYMLYGYSREDAEKIVAKDRIPESEAQRQRRTAREERENRAYYERESRRAEREAARRNSPSYRAGRQAGDSVGLDAQVSRGAETKKIGG